MTGSRTADDKRVIAAKAKQLDLPISELRSRGACAYESGEAEADLATLADAARDAAELAGAAIEDALPTIEASNRRIAAMEAEAAKRRAPRAA